MILLGSTRSKLTKNENGEDVPNLEICQKWYLVYTCS